MQIRVNKLLILVGEQGADLQARDFKKLSEVIVNEYLSQENNTNFKNFLVTAVAQVVRLIPEKYHLYAGLTAAISRSQDELSSKILEAVLNNLQTDLNSSKSNEVINTINYLSELMNISLLNSLSFLNILEDILNIAEKEHQQSVRKYLISILIRSLPLFANSLNQKIYHEFKKFIERLKKLSESDELFEYIYSQFAKGTIKSYSQIDRLSSDFSELKQFNTKFKLHLEVKWQKQRDNHEFYNWMRVDNDQHYKQFKKKEGVIHKNTIQLLIQAFYKTSAPLTLKIINFANSKKQPQTVKHLIEILIAKCLKSKKPLVQFSVLVSLSLSDQFPDASKIIENYLYELFSIAENFQLSLLINFSKMFSFILNNWKGQFDWQKYLEGQEHFSKRAVLLKFILQKLTLLNDKFICHKSLQKYQPLKPITNEEDYKSVQDLQDFEYLTEQLKLKTDAVKLKTFIINQHKYELFLEALFRKTSISQTHLNILSQRYNQILVACKDYDWDLINKIRNFFKNSFFHRLFYLKFMINKKILTFTSYINYVGSLKDKTQQDMIWIKMELNELNSEFGKTLKMNK